jgi:hypothetical protein
VSIGITSSEVKVTLPKQAEHHPPSQAGLVFAWLSLARRKLLSPNRDVPAQVLLDESWQIPPWDATLRLPAVQKKTELAEPMRPVALSGRRFHNASLQRHFGLSKHRNDLPGCIPLAEGVM